MQDNRMHDATKLCFHADRVQPHFDEGYRIPPVHIDMGIAKFCNISCSFCYGKYQDIKPIFIKQDALLQTIKDASTIGVKSLAFIGDGEPTCNPYMYDALELARDYTRLDMAISTNGVLVSTMEKCNSILSSCKWMRFCISAGTREGYKKIHAKDYFNHVIKNIQRMVVVKSSTGYPCDVGMQAVFVPTTMKQEMIEEAKLAVSLGVDYFVIKQCSLPDAGESGMSTFDLNDYDKKETDEVLRTCESMATKDTQIIVKWGIMKQKGFRPYQGCPSVPFISEMSGNGDWYPCGHMFGDKPQFSNYKFGNVHEKSLKEIYESEHYWDIIQKMRYDFDVQKQCKGACRLDRTNEFCWNYLHADKNGQRNMFKNSEITDVKGINFI